jgi:hypothetical protein
MGRNIPEFIALAVDRELSAALALACSLIKS